MTFLGFSLKSWALIEMPSCDFNAEHMNLTMTGDGLVVSETGGNSCQQCTPRLFPGTEMVAVYDPKVTVCPLAVLVLVSSMIHPYSKTLL
jgi:hypothetical protein